MATIRKVVFIEGQYYHVYNRGIERRKIYTKKREYGRMMDLIQYYRFAENYLRFSKYNVLNQEARQRYHQAQEKNNPLLVDILAFALMPNHYHFLLKQNVDHGISTFISNIQNSYTKYFNTKYERPGPLFQGTFKATWIDGDEELFHVSRYIHLNPVASPVITEPELDTYLYTSFPDYMSTSPRDFIHTDHILGNFTQGQYRTFVYDRIEYAKSLEAIKHAGIDI